jgi:hypothetical protein
MSQNSVELLRNCGVRAYILGLISVGQPIQPDQPIFLSKKLIIQPESRISPGSISDDFQEGPYIYGDVQLFLKSR